MTRRRPSLLHFVVTVLLACQSLVASAALPYGCAAQGFQPVASPVGATAAAEGPAVVHDHGHVHCDGATLPATDALPAVDLQDGGAGDTGDGHHGASTHGAASCHCLHSNGCATLSTVSVPRGPRAAAPVPQAAADRVEPFLPTEHRPPISPAAS